MDNKFFKKEIKDIIISIIILTILFTIYFINKIHGTINDLSMVITISAVIMTISIFLKAFAQKKVARKYKFTIQYQIWGYGILFAIVSTLLTIFIATPGCLNYGLYGRMASEEEKGKISLAGPLTNIVLALISLLIILVLSPTTTIMQTNINSIILTASYIGFIVNSYMALFNTVPFMFLDGVNLLNWNYKIFTVIIGFSLILTGLIFTNFLI